MDIKLVFALALLFPGFAQADDTQFPSRRPGLWEGSTKIGDMTRESKSCVDPNADRKMIEFGGEQMKKMGGKMDVSVDGHTIHVTTVATIGGHTIRSEETLVLVGDSTMTGIGHTTFDPPFPQMEKAFPGDTRMEDHWVGPCPADMRPGDMITNGQKFNVLKPDKG